MHNRGLAVDVGLCDLEGRMLDMGSAFDFFGRKAHHDYMELPKDILWRRAALKKTMAEFGFNHTRTEWWHYSDKNNWHEITNFEWKCQE